MTDPNPPDAPLTSERLAESFHEAYERLAPGHGYETREASAKPWADVPANNRALMTAVCAEVLLPLLADHARLTADPGYDADAVERAASELDDSGRGGDRLGDVVRNLAALLDRRTAALAVAERLAFTNGFEAARLAPYERTAVGWRRRAEEADRRLQAVRMLKVWTNEDRRKFVFADDLWLATDPDVNPTPAGLSPTVQAEAEAKCGWDGCTDSATDGMCVRHTGTNEQHPLVTARKAQGVNCDLPRPCRLHDAEPAVTEETWRQYTVERDSSDDGVSVLCREDDTCMENSGEDGVAASRYLTLGEAVQWAREHAESIFHVDPDARTPASPATAGRRLPSTQTATHDDLRRHLVAVHCDGMAINGTDADAIDAHQHEHDGPGTIRHHDRTDLYWDQVKLDAVLAEFAGDPAAPDVVPVAVVSRATIREDESGRWWMGCAPCDHIGRLRMGQARAERDRDEHNASVHPAAPTAAANVIMRLCRDPNCGDIVPDFGMDGHAQLHFDAADGGAQ